jgi:hypothetical protein
MTNKNGVSTCNDCANFEGWLVYPALGSCLLADLVTGELCPDFKEVLD